MSEPQDPWWSDAPSLPPAGRRYLDLLRRTLTREAFLDQESKPVDLNRWPDGKDAILPTLRANHWQLVEPVNLAAMAEGATRTEGKDWPPTAETMVGHRRLENTLRLACRAIETDVPGDFVETGVWRGGVTILLRAVLAAYDIDDRTVWVADSFEGLPVPDVDRYPADALTADMSGIPALMVGVEQVKANFARYELLDDQVQFLEGWFEDTLPTAPIEQIALLRLDGDLYQSTMDALTALYQRVSPAGFVLVDDYGAWESCKAAVDEYRTDHKIDSPITTVDWTGAWWQVPIDR